MKAVGWVGDSTPAHQVERSFGIVVGSACLLVAGLVWWRRHPAWVPVVGGFGIALLLGGLVYPACLRGPQLVWERLVHVLGWINTRILLSVVFVGVVTPVGWCLRRLGWDPLRMRGRPDHSAWTPSPERHQDPKHFERMY